MNDKIIYKDTGENNLDDLFRQGMTDHRVEPSPQVWNGISRKLLWREMVRFNFKNFSAKLWSFVAITGIITGVAVYMAVPVKKTAESNPAETKPTVNIVNTSGTVHNENENAGTAQMNSPARKTQPASEISAFTAPATVKVSKPVTTKPQSRVTAESQVTPGTDSNIPRASETVQPVVPRSEIEITSLKMRGTRELLLPHNKDDFDSIITINTVRGPEKFRFPSGKIPGMFSVTVGILPEMAYYNDAEKYSKTNYWVHGGFTWHISRFSIGTAVELGYVLDQGKYNVEYKSNDSIGYFNNVVSFTTGSNNEIIYNTVATAIYDSLNHYGDYRTTNRYTYLRFPLLIGYRIVETKKFSVTIKTGPAISVLLGTRKSDPVIEYSNARIIRIDEDTPEKMKTNWQLWANLNFEYRLNRKFSFNLEPSFKYFMKPTAEQESTGAKPPMSFGLGIGIQVNFDNRK